MNFIFFLGIVVCVFVIKETYASDKKPDIRGKLPPPECVKDSDCPWMLRCINGRCEMKKDKEPERQAKLPPPECVKDSDCPWMLRCINGRCEMKKDKEHP